MNDETALKELLSMSRIYYSRGQADRAEECLVLARQIQKRMTVNSSILITQRMEAGQEQGQPGGLSKKITTGFALSNQ